MVIGRKRITSQCENNKSRASFTFQLGPLMLPVKTGGFFNGERGTDNEHRKKKTRENHGYEAAFLVLVSFSLLHGLVIRKKILFKNFLR